MKIDVVDRKPQIAVAIKRTAVGMNDLLENIDEMSGKLAAYLAEQGKEIAGAPYLAYMNLSEDYSSSDIEWGFPIAEPVPDSGEFYMTQTYGGKAITATHKGAYSDLETAYGAMMDYAKENSLESTGVYYDYYLNDPETTPESELLTEIVFPVK